MKLFECVIDDGKDVKKIIVPATSQRTLKSEYDGNADIIRVKEVTTDYPIDIRKVVEALEVADFGDVEIRLITVTLGKTLENTTF